MEFNIRKFDWTLFFLMLILLAAGLASVYSVSVVKIGDQITVTNYFSRQLIWIGFSLLLLIIIQLIPTSFFRDYSLIFYLLSIALLIAVLFLPQIKGSHRWIKIGGFQFQPSEFTRITYILVMVKYLTDRELREYVIILRAFLISIPLWVLLLLEPDLGSTITYGLVFFTILLFLPIGFDTILFLASPILSILFYVNIFVFLVILMLVIFYFIKASLGWVKLTFLLILNAFFTVNLSLVWNLLKEYQRVRIQAFFDPLSDPLGSGYQIIQSKIAIGSGELMGKGFISSTQKSFSFLPEYHTDYIFSIFSEEWGFFGNALFLLIWFLFFYRIIYITQKIASAQARLVNLGLFSFVLYQFALNILVAMGYLPSTGIPLPLFSYGGSNIVVTIISIAFILKLPKHK